MRCGSNEDHPTVWIDRSDLGQSSSRREGWVVCGGGVLLLSDLDSCDRAHPGGACTDLFVYHSLLSSVVVREMGDAWGLEQSEGRP